MANFIEKLNIGRKIRRSYFPLQHDVNTTSDFGFCQPTLCRPFYKDTKISLQTKEFVRLSAMPVPTFGRVEVKTHTAFVPVKDVFPAYDFFQSQKTVQSAARSYVPKYSDHITANNILRSIIEVNYDSRNNFTLQQSTMNVSSQIDLQRFFFRTSVWTRWSKICPSDHSLYSQHKPDDYVDVVNDDVVISDTELATNGAYILCNFLDSGTSSSVSNSQFFTFLNQTELFGTMLPVGIQNTISGSQYSTTSMLYFPFFGTYKSNRIYPVFPDQPPVNSWILRTYRNLDYYGYGNESYRNAFLADMSLDNADFVLPSTSIVGYTNYDGDSITDVPIKIGLHFTLNGSRLLKVLTGCRISFGTKYKPYELMRLLSYYKVWFDKYNPGRNLQWLDTSAYRLIHSFYDYGVALQFFVTNTGSDISVVPTNIRQRVLQSWWNFLVDLPQCCYVLPLDNMTCATETPLINVANNTDSIESVRLYGNNNLLDSYSSVESNNSHIYGLSNDVLDTGGLGVKLLERIYHLVNKNSVIGAKVDDYLRVHNISRGLPKTQVLGDDTFMCNIDDVFSTVQSEESYLGEYAGKGIGANHNPKSGVNAPVFKFETESFGYLIQLLCVVPLGGYVQGTTDGLIERYDFYQSEFDSLGMEPMNKSEFLNRRYLYDTFKETDVVFGFRPRYFKLKIENNLANGGFSQRSKMRYFLPYSLDRIFDVNQSSDSLLEDEYVADEELRYIGRYEQFGNYDRMFYDNTGLTDNFIVHIIQDLQMWAPMKPVSESWDTFDKDSDDDSVKIEKS